MPQSRSPCSSEYLISESSDLIHLQSIARDTFKQKDSWLHSKMKHGTAGCQQGSQTTPRCWGISRTIVEIALCRLVDVLCYYLLRIFFAQLITVRWSYDCSLLNKVFQYGHSLTRLKKVQLDGDCHQQQLSPDVC